MVVRATALLCTAAGPRPQDHLGSGQTDHFSGVRRPWIPSHSKTSVPGGYVRERRLSGSAEAAQSGNYGWPRTSNERPDHPSCSGCEFTVLWCVLRAERGAGDDVGW